MAMVVEVVEAVEMVVMILMMITQIWETLSLALQNRTTYQTLQRLSLFWLDPSEFLNSPPLGQKPKNLIRSTVPTPGNSSLSYFSVIWISRIDPMRFPPEVLKLLMHFPISRGPH
jgi:hypothetical protein